MHRIWAVAKNTMAQAFRMKVALVMLLLLILLLPLMAMILTGDGSLLGKLQSFSSYGISLVSLLLCVLTISVSCFTLSNDLKRRHLDLVLTKPIFRFQIVLGKMLGVILMNLLLLGFFSLIVFGLTYLIPMIQQSTPLEKARAETEFFTARKVVRPVIDEESIQKRAYERFEKIKKAESLPES